MSSSNEIKSIVPVSELGPGVFHVTSSNDRAVFLRLDHRGWHACSSKEQAFDGGALVADGEADLLEAAGKALTVGRIPPTLVDLESERRRERMHAANRW